MIWIMWVRRCVRYYSSTAILFTPIRKRTSSILLSYFHESIYERTNMRVCVFVYVWKQREIVFHSFVSQKFRESWKSCWLNKTRSCFNCFDRMLLWLVNGEGQQNLRKLFIKFTYSVSMRLFFIFKLLYFLKTTA